MYVYRSEILTVSSKWFSGMVNEKDLFELDELINMRACEGWELVTYNYIATSGQVKGAFVLTFRMPA